MNAQNIRPPKALEKFLSWICKGELLEEILGDLEEYHYELLEQPRWKRRLFYWFQVLNFLRPFALRGITANHRFNHTVMFRNYFKTSLRSLLKSPLSSFINVFGLAAAIGICVLVYGFAQWTYRTDQFHANKNEVYLTTFFANRDGDSQQHGQTPRPIGAMLKEDFSHVEKVCRVDDRNVVMKYGDKVFHEQVRLTDPTFLEMFTFPLKWGVTGSLSDVNSIILSEEMSVKYFGEENPVGQNLLVIFGKSNSKTFTVAGVAAEFPASRTIDFGFLIHFDNHRVADAAFDLNDWGAFVNATFVQVSNASDVKAIEAQMGKYQQLQNAAAQEDWAITSFAFEPLATLHERSEFIKDDISWSSASNYSSVIYLSVVGILLLALACFNYINIAIVSSAKRLKEIAIRKTIGAHKGVVVVQFLAENLVVTFFALVLGLVLGMVIFIPGFEQMWHFNMGFSLTDPKLFIYLGAVLFFTAAASGVYPAFYISKFEVVRILKGTVQFGKKNPLTKILLCIQLIIACILITSAVMFTQNTSYLAKRSWGYQPREALYAQIPDVAAFDQLKAAMAQNPNIVSLSGSADHLGRQSGTVVVRTPDRQYEVDRMQIDANYFATMGVEIKEGRNFKDNYESDKQAVIVNEALVAALSQGEPLGQVFKIDSTQYEIIGVVGEVHHRSFFNTIRPTIYTVAERDDFRYLSMKVRPGSEKETYQALQDNWVALFPELPFQGGFQENVWGNYYEEIGIHATVWQVFAFIAISMASLGLYGLIRLNVAGRIREFSIRKVLGASLRHLAANITKQYQVLFVAALVAGAPVSYILVKLIITTSYEYHMPITYSGVALAVGILVTVLIATVSTQVKTVSKANPAKGLRVE